MTFSVIDPAHIRDITSQVFHPNGEWRLRNDAYWKTTTPNERALLGHVHGLYHLPTRELCEWLFDHCKGQDAIELCAGRGLLCEALGIPGYDNMMQSWKSIANKYAAMGQPTIKYGKHVREGDANAVARERKPDIIITAWMTHRYDPRQHERGGNEHGPDHVQLLTQCRELIFIGNMRTHQHHPLLRYEHKRIPVPVYSRAQGGEDFAAIFIGHRRG